MNEGVVILDNGGSALVGRRIQTPSVATVSGVVQGPGGSSSELPGPPAPCVFRRADYNKYVVICGEGEDCGLG
jgi:hypothetical protein